MKQAVELLDKKSFCKLLDQLVIAVQSEDDIETAVALDAVLEAAHGALVPAEGISRGSFVADLGPGPSPRVNFGPLAPEVSGDDLAMSSDEAQRVAQVADAMAAATVPRDVIVAEVIKEVVIPAYQRGLRTICVPLRWKQRAVSVSGNVWGPCMRQAGIPFNELLWVYDQRSWQGPVPQPGVNQPLVIQ